MAISLETFVHFEKRMPKFTNTKMAIYSAGTTRNEDYADRQTKHNLQTLHAKTPFLSICVERCGEFSKKHEITPK